MSNMYNQRELSFFDPDTDHFLCSLVIPHTPRPTICFHRDLSHYHFIGKCIRCLHTSLNSPLHFLPLFSNMYYRSQWQQRIIIIAFLAPFIKFEHFSSFLVLIPFVFVTSARQMLSTQVLRCEFSSFINFLLFRNKGRQHRDFLCWSHSYVMFLRWFKDYVKRLFYYSTHQNFPCVFSVYKRYFTYLFICIMFIQRSHTPKFQENEDFNHKRHVSLCVSVSLCVCT